MSFLERLLRGLGGHPGESYRRGHGGSHHGGYRYQRGGSPTDYSPQQDMPPASADCSTLESVMSPAMHSSVMGPGADAGACADVGAGMRRSSRTMCEARSPATGAPARNSMRSETIGKGRIVPAGP